MPVEIFVLVYTYFAYNHSNRFLGGEHKAPIKLYALSICSVHFNFIQIKEIRGAKYLSMWLCNDYNDRISTAI